MDPPGEIRSGGAERVTFASGDGRFTTGLWAREPDKWSFERPHDEVALILEGAAEMETSDGRALALGPGDVVVTPTGSKGTWRIRSPLLKFFAIYEGGPVGDATIRHVPASEPLEWIVLENPPGDEDPPGEEWYAYRSADRRFSTGFWRRAPETGAFEREYHEIAIITEGEVDVETAGGNVLRSGPGDVLVTPSGSAGVWRARSAVRKFWAVYHE